MTGWAKWNYLPFLVFWEVVRQFFIKKPQRIEMLGDVVLLLDAYIRLYIIVHSIMASIKAPIALMTFSDLLSKALPLSTASSVS